MTEEAIAVPMKELSPMDSIYAGENDPEMEKIVEQSVTNILFMDERFNNADIETIDAIRDWVRAEAILSRAFSKFMKGDTTASTERMFRHASMHKNSLRDEIFGKFKGRGAKKEEIDYANKILIDSGAIEPRTEVDPLADK